HCSLGRVPNRNIYNTYRRISGSFGYSCSTRVLARYSGQIEAFLTSNHPHAAADTWYHPMLPLAAADLRKINPYLNIYHVALQSSTDIVSHPIAHRLRLENDAPGTQRRRGRPNEPRPGDIIVPVHDFHPEVHDEDFHCSRLMIGFVQPVDSLDKPLPIS